MGIYDVNLKKTNIGYQFDRNVYIGIQTNDNRVVTFKDLGEAIVTSGVGGGGEDIHLTFDNSNVTPNSDPQNFVNHVTFLRKEGYVAYDILPQYVRAAEAGETFDYASSTVCLLRAIRKAPAEGEEVGDIIGYQLYSSTLPALNINFQGIQSYSYNGTSAVTINFTTIPTVSTSAVNIVTEIPNNDTSEDIPTAGAVHKFAAAAGSVKATASVAGYILGTPTQVTAPGVGPNTPALPPVGGNVKWGTSASNVGAAASWINANITGQLNKTLSIAAGSRYYFDGSENVNIEFDTLPTVSTSSLGVTATIPASESSADADIPTAGAVREAIGALAPGIRNLNIDGSGPLVNNLTYNTNTNVLTAYKNTSLANANLSWGTTTTYATVESNTYSISLPTVDTIPTVSTSSIEITNTIATNPTGSAIPTDLAVINALERAPGIATVTPTGSGAMVTSITYDRDNHVLSYNKATASVSGRTISINGNSTTWTDTNTASLSWDDNNRAVKAGVDNTLATIPTASSSTYGLVTLGTGNSQAARGDHTHANFTVFGQTYNGATARTVTASNGITVSNGSVSLHATFNNATLAWGSPVTYATVAGAAKTLSLPQVTTIPTVSTSSMGITNTISSSSSNIPTSQAVYNAIRNKFSYNSSTGVLTIIDA